MYALLIKDCQRFPRPKLEQHLFWERECENCLELLWWLPSTSGRPKTKKVNIEAGGRGFVLQFLWVIVAIVVFYSPLILHLSLFSQTILLSQGAKESKLKWKVSCVFSNEFPISLKFSATFFLKHTWLKFLKCL